MSTSIRLAKTGKKNAPTYKVVVSNVKDKRNGKFLDILGIFNPLQNEGKATINMEKFNAWKAKGSIVSKAVNDLLEGTYKYIKYTPKAKE